MPTAAVGDTRGFSARGECVAMATPLGHALAGYAIYSFARGAQRHDDLRLMIACVFMAIAPDLDLLPGLLMGTPAQYHQGITHTLGLALPLSFGVAAISGIRGRSFLMVFSCCVLAYLSHLVLDLLNPDTRPPYGIQLFWPISGEYFISPVPILLGVRHATSPATSIQAWVQRMLHVHNLAAIAWEALLIVPFILLGQWYRSDSLGRQAAN
jgi:membrane-bound metal-dependent hydrolase YbcI (DUF457 family)